MAQVTFKVAGMLAPFTGQRREFHVEASTLAEALEQAKALYPMLGHHLEDEAGARRPNVNLYYNGKDLRALGSLERPVVDGDQVVILSAMSGGLY
jgi:molybdopterin converting factor small subunit